VTRRSRSTAPSGDGLYAQAELPQPYGPAVPICWAAYTTENQDLLLEDLTTWVNWVARHYSLDRRQVPECWDQHWELIEELAALHLAWEGAYSSTAHADAALSWHERFAAARARLTDWVARTGCRPGEHRATT
jgi:hypothetical protein